MPKPNLNRIFFWSDEVPINLLKKEYPPEICLNLKFCEFAFVPGIFFIDFAQITVM